MAMNALENKPKMSTRLSRLVEFIFGIENKKGEILDHWLSFLDNYELAPSEFYSRLKSVIENQTFPGLTVTQEEFFEGGALSEKRIYIRFFRERLAIYTCASPLGRGYFFSCRTVYVPAEVRLWHLLLIAGFFTALWFALIQPLGFTFAALALTTLPFALVSFLKRVAVSAATDLDSFLLRVPGLATIYEAWFRADTYWRLDSRLVYLQRIPALVREVAEEITAAKGVRLINQYQHAPIFADLYKPVRTEHDKNKADVCPPSMRI
jgi:hypothetical protein